MPTPEEMEAFRQRIMGAAPSLVAPVLGPAAQAIPYLPQAPGLLKSADAATGGMLSRAREVAQSNEGTASSFLPGGPADLNAKARAAVNDTVSSPGGTVLRPMYTPDVNVQAAPTLQLTQPKIGQPMGGGAGGGQYASLMAQYRGAQQGQLNALEEQKGLEGDLGMARAGRTMAVSGIQEANAVRQQRDAEVQQQHDQEAYAKHQAFMERNEQLADEIRSSKIDTGRYMRNANFGTQVAMGIGAVASGMLSALNGGPNQFLARMDRFIDQDIAAQEKEIDNKKAALSARQSMFGQMMQQTHDRQVAAQQTRALMYEAMKTDLQAKADQYGIPEGRAQTALVVNAVDQKLQAMKAGLAGDALAAYMKQAASAAAAQRAAEEKAWQHQLELIKLGQEQDKIEIEKQKASGLTGEELAKQTQQLGTALGAKDLTEGRAAVENAKRRLEGLKDNEGLPGVGKVADLRAGLRPEGINVINPVAQGLNLVAGLNDQERVSRGDWDKIKLAYQHQITGSGASTEERAMLSGAFEGAKSPAEQRNAIKQADDFFARREAAIKAGFDPRAVATFEQRMGGIRPELPSSVRVKK